MLETQRRFFVREHAGVLKLADTYDILDPDTQHQIGIAKDEPATWAKYLRLVVDKQLLPTTVNVYEREQLVLAIHKPFSVLRSKVTVTRRDGSSLGYFKGKIFSIGGGFWVFDAADQEVAEIKGDWKGWNFRFLGRDQSELGTITKKWAGLGKELLTSADNYVIALNDQRHFRADDTLLLLAAGIAIDVVFKERK
jgi:uncharacterized protein YxjI